MYKKSSFKQELNPLKEAHFNRRILFRRKDNLLED